jgi:hypothetical protein
MATARTRGEGVADVWFLEHCEAGGGAGGGNELFLHGPGRGAELGLDVGAGVPGEPGAVFHLSGLAG